MNIVLIREPAMLPEFVNLHPVMTMPSKIAPVISNTVRPPSTLVVSTNNWLVFRDEDINQEEVYIDDCSSSCNVSYHTEPGTIDWE